MKTIQKTLVVAALVASLALGVITAFAESSKDETNPQQPDTTTLTRKVNEYEGQF